MTNRFVPVPTPDPLPSGQKLNVCFTNLALANTTQPIGASDAGGANAMSFDVQLNDSGYGCYEFLAPLAWSAVVLSHSTSSDYSVIIV